MSDDQTEAPTPFTPPTEAQPGGPVGGSPLPVGETPPEPVPPPSSEAPPPVEAPPEPPPAPAEAPPEPPTAPAAPPVEPPEAPPEPPTPSAEDAPAAPPVDELEEALEVADEAEVAAAGGPTMNDPRPRTPGEPSAGYTGPRSA